MSRSSFNLFRLTRNVFARGLLVSVVPVIGVSTFLHDTSSVSVKCSPFQTCRVAHASSNTTNDKDYNNGTGGMSAKQKSRFLELFVQLDVDQNGTLDFLEFKSAFRRALRLAGAQSENEAQQVIDDITDEVGDVSYAAGWKLASKAAFELMDTSHDNVVDQNEFLAVMDCFLSLAQVFRDIDTSHDDYVSLSEFNEGFQRTETFSSLITLRNKVQKYNLSTYFKKFDANELAQAWKLAGLNDDHLLSMGDFAAVVFSSDPVAFKSWAEMYKGVPFDMNGTLPTKNIRKSLEANGLIVQVLLGGTAGSMATIATNPIDVVKVRLQLAAKQTPPINMFTTSVNLYRHEGITSFWKGISTAIARSYTYSAMRLGMYSMLKDHFMNPDGTMPLVQKLGCGVISGACAAAFANPVEVMKVRLQSAKTGTSVSKQLKLMANEGGIVSNLYAGLLPHIARGALITAVQLASYDQIKNYMRQQGIEEGLPLHFAAAMGAGLLTNTASAPADMIKTNAMSSGISAMEAVKRIHAEAGVKGFVRGWMPNYLRMGPQTVLMMIAYEHLRKLAGLHSV